MNQETTKQQELAATPETLNSRGNVRTTIGGDVEFIVATDGDFVRFDDMEQMERQRDMAQKQAGDWEDTFTALIDKIGYTEEVATQAEAATGKKWASDGIAWWWDKQLDEARCQLAEVKKLTDHPETVGERPWVDGLTVREKVLKLLDERSKFRWGLRMANQQLTRLDGQLADAQAQNLALREALTNCREDSAELLGERHWWQHEPRCGYDERYKAIESNVTGADKALSAPPPPVVPQSRYDELWRLSQDLVDAHDELRDIVLHERGPLAEEHAPVNAVLGAIDDSFSAAIEALAAHEAIKAQEKRV